jgi:phosphoribosylamine--glycine ligase
VTVVLAAPGYPAAPATGGRIEGVAEAERLPGVSVFHAGTALDGGRLVTAGGRVLAVSARGRTLAAARELAYEASDLIAFEGVQRRGDIGLAAVRGEAAHAEA